MKPRKDILEENDKIFFFFLSAALCPITAWPAFTIVGKKFNLLLQPLVKIHLGGCSHNTEQNFFKG